MGARDGKEVRGPIPAETRVKREGDGLNSREGRLVRSKACHPGLLLRPETRRMGTPIGTREPERGSEGLLVSRQHSRVWPGKPLLHANPLHGGQSQLSSLHANFLPNRYCLPSGSGPPESHQHEARHTQREGICLGPHGLGGLGSPRQLCCRVDKWPLLTRE